MSGELKLDGEFGESQDFRHFLVLWHYLYDNFFGEDYPLNASIYSMGESIRVEVTFPTEDTSREIRDSCSKHLDSILSNFSYKPVSSEGIGNSFKRVYEVNAKGNQ